MDDGVTEIRELVLSDQKDNMSPPEKKQRVEEKEEPHSNGRVINNLISSFMSNDKEVENAADGMKDETKEEEKEGGGILNNLISSLVSPRSKAADDTFTSVDDEKMANQENGSGGIFNSLISGILHRDDEAGADGGNDKLPAEEGSGGGGGFIDNLVSQLPSPLSDEAVPQPDEASILIHSIVHD